MTYYSNVYRTLSPEILEHYASLSTDGKIKPYQVAAAIGQSVESVRKQLEKLVEIGALSMERRAGRYSFGFFIIDLASFAAACAATNIECSVAGRDLIPRLVGELHGYDAGIRAQSLLAMATRR